MINEFQAEGYFQKLTSYLASHLSENKQVNIVKVDYVRNNLLVTIKDNSNRKLVEIPFTKLHIDNCDKINDDITYIMNR